MYSGYYESFHIITYTVINGLRSRHTQMLQYDCRCKILAEDNFGTANLPTLKSTFLPLLLKVCGKIGTAFLCQYLNVYISPPWFYPTEFALHSKANTYSINFFL